MTNKTRGSVLPRYTPLVIGRNQVPLTLVNTAAQGNLFYYNMPAQSLLVYNDDTGPDTPQYGALRIKAFGKFLNNTAGNKDLRWQLFIGATNIFDSQGLTFANTAAGRTWSLDAIISLRNGNEKLQSILTEFKAGTPTIVSGGTPLFVSGNSLDNLALDFTVDQPIALYVTMSAADPNLSCTFDYFHVETI